MKNKILKLLRNLDQNDIAAITTHAVFGRGLDYFSGARVLAFTWSENTSELIALIRGSSGPYQIKITYNDFDDQESLEYHCTCPAWNQYDQCKHVICVLLTASHILNDQPIPGFSSTQLKEQLQNNTIDTHEDINTSTSTDKRSRQKQSLHVHLVPLGD